MGVSLLAALDHMASRVWAESFHFPKCNNTLGAEGGGAWAGAGPHPLLPAHPLLPGYGLPRL